MIGDTGENMTDLRKKMLYASTSGPVTALNLNGEKKLLVDLSDQKLFIMLDGQVIREFRVSTGGYKTPTPKGDYTIKLKQEVRVSGKAPHYIMPKFMWFREGGYGFHALPSLGSDGGVFWTEAKDHIGRPVSHGCIRLLPEDADFLYEFTDLGTKVTVQG
jgi:lipoprotein-anchoring transpeptidase ErfK/SrfK